MKTTIDLPEGLVQQLKFLAVKERQPLKRIVAHLLIKGLELPPAPSALGAAALPPGIETNEHGFPIFRCTGPAATSPMTATEVVAFEQQVSEEEDLNRVGLAP